MCPMQKKYRIVLLILIMIITYFAFHFINPLKYFYQDGVDICDV